MKKFSEAFLLLEVHVLECSINYFLDCPRRIFTVGVFHAFFLPKFLFVLCPIGLVGFFFFSVENPSK